MRQKRIIIGIGVFFTICLALYAYLGGFQEVKLTVESEDEYHIIGKYFEGKVESDTMKTIFLEAKTMAEKKIINGTVVVLYYKDASKGDDEIECFAGLLLLNKPENIPLGMEYRNFKSKGVIRAKFDGHRIVTPNPSRVKEEVNNYAKENNLTLQSLFIEKYFSNNAIEVDYLMQ